jgi:peptide/nickel transport system permease protein
MLAFTVKRIAQSVVLVFLMSIIVFVGMYVIGDPVAVLAGEHFTETDRAALRTALGLDQPLPVQYLNFLARAAVGDFGTSYVYGRPVLELILQRVPATLEVVVMALTAGLLVGVPLGIYSGLHRRAWTTRIVSFGTTLGYSIPSFWQALVLIIVFAVWLRILPASGRGATTPFLGIEWAFLNADGLRHMLLPALNLAIFAVCLHARLARSGTQEVLYQDFMTYARAKGIGRARLIGRHLLRNILIPIVTITGLEFGGLIAFSTVTETIFSWPGIGKLLLDSIHHADRPVVVAYLILITLMFVTINFVVDILYALLDPRIRY